MLDSETKRRIDSARDILVGKVPDPKSQVEQITIALIYKFMDDMDRQSIEMGGKASFFKGEFKKYGWGNIFDPRLGGVEMLNLYGEAITRMSQNANLPELFRNIFKNAYLPYRDPETLKLFLKTINDFTYDHSEKLGDAFEYLLSVLGSQGDAGQFRTPRHIIDFMVQVVDPKKNETILDPACGTAGFLISAYKHILQNNTDPKGLKKPLGSLTAQEKQKIYENFTGYDISPDMVRLSLVNLYLHGFVKPQIHEYDSLASEERWNEYADVILANPPFMSPKGGIMPHKKFSVQSNRSEVLFVDYMAEHLTPNGRAAIIVPEGIIFQSAGAYRQLRKYLIEHNFLWAVVSLPAGAFNPYSGVKTSILFLDKSLAKKTDKILFVKVENDGFDLGAQRRPIDKNDLPKSLKVLQNFQQTLRVSSTIKESDGKETLRVSPVDGKTASFAPETDSVLLVSISKLEESDYNLSADRYREVIRIGKQTYPMANLGDICEIISGQSPEGKYYNEQGEGMPFYQGKTEFTEKYLGAPTTWTTNVTKIAEKDDILMSVRAPVGPVNIATQKICIGRGLAAIRPDASKVLLEYVFINLRFMQDAIKGNSGSTFASINRSDIAKIQIPLPQLEIQRQIVDEINIYQKQIDENRKNILKLEEDIQSAINRIWEE
ncbi:MAG: N-6 DNA methylase [Anaerolineales bacterium]